MIDDHGEAIVSDLSEFHHLDLIAALRDHAHSPRTLLALVSQLPDTSALAASLRDEPRGWGADRHLAATLVDAVQVNTAVTAAHGSGKRPRKPKPVPRPTRRKSQRVVRVADLA